MVADAMYKAIAWTPFLAVFVGFVTFLACGVPYLEVMTNGSETVFPNSISAIPDAQRPSEPHELVVP